MLQCRPTADNGMQVQGVGAQIANFQPEHLASRLLAVIDCKIHQPRNGIGNLVNATLNLRSHFWHWIICWPLLW